MSRNIVLTGFMAAGKTTVAKELAHMTGMKLADTDTVITELEGKTITQIFADSGEGYFRDVESTVCKCMAFEEDTVIATGGGVVLRSENIDELRKNGIIFLIDAGFEVIEMRLEQARAMRPLIVHEDIDGIRKRFLDRKRYYDNCDYRIPITANTTPESAAERIIEIYNKLK